MLSGALLERERELAALEWAVAAAADGEGRVVTISGEAGLGKTRLLEALTARAGEEGYEVLAVRGSELERELGWGLATDALEPALGRRSSDERTELLSGKALLARALLEPEDPEHDPGTAPPRQLAAVAAALTALTQRLAAEHPLALIVDDAHWADAESLRWLNHLAGRLGADLPVVLVAAFRTGEPGSPSELLGRLTAAAELALELSPLSLDATSVLVEPTLGDAERVQAVHEVTRGNPFMIDQLLRHLDPAKVTVRSIREARPRELRLLVLPRIERLGSDARVLSETVAILAGGADLTTAAALARLSEEAVADAAEKLARAGLFADELPLRFAHPLLRSVVADSLTAARADLLHRNAARVLAAAGAEPTEAAVHLLSAGLVAEPWARELLCAAGLRAMDRGAPESAAAFFGRALLEPHHSAEHELLLDHGRALLQAGSERALEVLEHALEMTPDAVDRAGVALEVGDALMAVDRPSEAVSVYETGIAALTDPQDPLRIHLLAQRALGALALTDESSRATAAVIEAIEAIGRWPTGARRSALALKAVVAVWTGQPAAQCVALLEEALGAPRYGGGPALEWSPDLAWVLAMLAWCDAHDRRDAFLESVIARARQRGALVELALATAHQSYGLIRRGRLREAERAALIAIEIFTDMQAGPNPMAIAAAIDALIARGAFDAADRLAAGPTFNIDEDRVVYLAFLDARARLRIAQGRAQEAQDDLELIRDEIESHQFLCPAAVAWRSQLAVVHHSLGDVVRGRTLAAEEVTLARAFGAPRALGLALIAAGAVEVPDQAQAALREAIEILAASPARLEYAQALVALGGLLRRLRSREEAISVLREGLDVAASCEADALVAAARSELKVAGSRPRRERVHGPDSLTEGERRVASLAAEGATNAEIARKLVVSLRTVETHLTSAYRKLDISGRGDLRAALQEAPSVSRG